MAVSKEFIKDVGNGIKNNKLILVVARCTVEYNGRAKSFLDSGERLITIKPDGTLLVHQPTGSVPVNYMKDGCLHDLKETEEGVFLESYRQKEFMKILFENISFYQCQGMNDGSKISLVGSERDMAGHIVDNPILISKNFKPVKTEEQTEFGFIDVLGYEGDKLVVVECKRFTANLNAVSQLRRYVEKVKSSKGIDKVKGILASPKISPNALKMLKEWGFSHVVVSPPKHFDRYSESQKRLF